MTGADGGGAWVAPRPAAGVLDAAARLYFSRFGPFFLVALGGSVLEWLLGQVGARPVPVPPGAPAFSAFVFRGGTLANPLAALLSGLVLLATYGALLTLAGAVAMGASDETAGPGAAGAALAGGLRRFWPLLVTMVTIGLAGGAALLLLIVPGVVLLTWWGLAAPVAVLERRRALASLGRSRELVRGLFWHVLGTLVLAAVLTLIVSAVLLVIGLPLHHIPGPAGAALAGLWSAAVRAAVSPYSAAVTTLLYVDLRARKEGFDLTPDDGGGPHGGSGDGALNPT